ncbi:MAG: hypothetical protein Q8O88_06050 [bacterium]|nr:hypothetical protein [bacterium]
MGAFYAISYQKIEKKSRPTVCYIGNCMLYSLYMDNRVEKLINTAKRRMKHSNDPAHDLDHVARVVKSVKDFTRDLDLTAEEKNAVVLAAWWHDVSRSITKKPSFVLMSFVDDTISALMLWYGSIRCGLFGNTVGLSTRILFCKSIGTGAILTKLLLRKKHRILMNILDDADTLDMINGERIVRLLPLIENSRTYRLGYKLAIAWCLKSRELKLRTEQARKVLIEMFKKFMAWIKQKEIFDWHVNQFGEKWVRKALRNTNRFINNLTLKTCS